MNFVEKHELIQKTIKDNCDKKLKDIEALLEKAFATNGRQITEAFSFYTGASLSAYLKQERNRKIYLYSQEQNCSMEEAAAIFGSDLPTFSKSFKRDFGKSPSQMSKEEFDNLPDEFSINSILGEKDMLPVEENMECVFGIPKDKYKQLMDVLKYSSAYGFSQKKAQQAYEISEKMNVAISDAFEFVDQCVIEDIDPNMFISGEAEHKVIYKTYAMLFFKYGLTIARAKEELGSIGVKDIFKEPEEVVVMYFSDVDGRYSYGFYKELYNILKKRKQLDLYEDIIIEGQTDACETPEEFIEDYFMWKEVYEKESKMSFEEMKEMYGG